MNFDLTWLLWAFLILSTLSPLISRWRLEAARTRLIRKIEHSRNSRVITLIHRQETVAFLGIPVARYIDIEDSEEILRAVRLTDPAVPLDIILHTPGGLVLAAEQIAHALIRHKAPVTVFVPHYAMSGGTLLALSADNIVLDPNAVLGPVDPQLGEYPAASVLEVLNLKPVDHIDDRILILADVARKAIVQVKYSVRDLLISNGMEPQKAMELATVLSTGTWTHDYPISCEQARELGLPIDDISMPKEIYELMNLYRTVSQRRPSVQYIPVPYAPPPPPAPVRTPNDRP